MSTIKIPFLLANAYFAEKALTPPNPTPPGAEMVMEQEKRYFRRGSSNDALAKFLNFLYSAACIAECTVVWTTRNPTHHLSNWLPEFMLYTTTQGGCTSQISISTPFMIGSFLLVAGPLLRLYCFRQLGTLFTFSFTIQKDHKLITHGPYAYVRHPSYTGGLLQRIGMVICHLTPGSWFFECGVWRSYYVFPFLLLWILVTALRLIYAFVRSGHEDEALRKKFGDEWDSWAKKVPYCIIPGVI